eukprot:CAMPEP_0114579272 /NCGR_PEP_ID=MMETSP0125-20121206/3682_1 /TAXON_ID=485358 ORGANISM="Aristerostoma sp., Strain ATCC 50986" /NCGR_SAMPLE_ID=MMETSP0125 /ASSEMBLY_ACC=CAM_ASM_000245 /LENGTH=101 /DNA_ID=CAMNT_0001769917 /DNA_START=837 /DNA_END=1145 /DNA_ORIENTATION=+
MRELVARFDLLIHQKYSKMLQNIKFIHEISAEMKDMSLQYQFLKSESKSDKEKLKRLIIKYDDQSANLKHFKAHAESAKKKYEQEIESTTKYYERVIMEQK